MKPVPPALAWEDFRHRDKRSDEEAIVLCEMLVKLRAQDRITPGQIEELLMEIAVLTARLTKAEILERTDGIEHTTEAALKTLEWMQSVLYGRESPSVLPSSYWRGHLKPEQQAA